MKLLWAKLTGVPPTTEMVGWTTSLVVHALGAAIASAAFVTVAQSPPVLPGDRLQTQIELRAELCEPEAPPPTAIRPSDPVLVVMPQQARMAAKRFAQASPDVSQPTLAELAWAKRLLAEPVAASEPNRASPAASPATAGSPTTSPPPHRTARSVAVRALRAEPSPAAVRRLAAAGTSRQIPPQLRHNRPPDYPLEARRAGFEGTVVLRAAVAADGRVGKVEIAQSSGHRVLDAAAIRAVRSWQYEPAYRDGQPVPATIRQPVRFSLGD